MKSFKAFFLWQVIRNSKVNLLLKEEITLNRKYNK